MSLDVITLALAKSYTDQHGAEEPLLRRELVIPTSSWPMLQMSKEHLTSL